MSNRPVQWNGPPGAFAPRLALEMLTISLISCPRHRYASSPTNVMAFYTRQARREGISRNALLVRVLSEHARQRHATALTVDDLVASASRMRDLDDPDVMNAAWS